MHIKQLRIQNFRCFEDVTIDFDDDVNVFVGNNGSGKSAVLDAVAGVLYPLFLNLTVSNLSKRPTSPVTQDDLRISDGTMVNDLLLGVTTKGFYQWRACYSDRRDGSNDDHQSLSFGEMAFEDDTDDDDDMPGLKEFEQDLTTRLRESEDLPVIAYYTAKRSYRSEKKLSPYSTPRPDRLDAVFDCLQAGTSYREMQEWLNAREIQELRKGRDQGNLKFQLADLQQIRSAVSLVVKPASRVYFSEQYIKPTLMVEWDNHGSTKRFTLNQLSDGYRNMLALVMDFARRMAQANPQMENPLEAEAILMIDEIDLHLHPTWQQRVIPDLKRAFPNTQIICTTHSPEVVSTVNGSQVKILEGNQVRDCLVPTEGMKSSDVVRYVLGLEDLRPPANVITEKITALFDAIDDRDLETAKKLRDELRVRDPQRYDSDLIRADVSLRRLEHSQPK